MVAKITIPKSLVAALNYNEKKVQKGVAKCLYAGNYLQDAGKINFYQKQHGFEINNRLNKMATTKTLHVSLNFDPSEKHKDDKLVEIASTYMNKIGFGEQPFLVYKHEDAGHPHIHIVSTTIRNNGTRINTHNIGRNQSETARKEIEVQFGVVKAERQKQSLQSGVQTIIVDRAHYGLSETKRSISNAVITVFNQYKFASLPEYNAALKQFNVVADRGKGEREGKIYRNKGLVYRILDAAGNKVGVPIKASSISGKPTLANLEKKFAVNAASKESFKLRTKSIVDDCLRTSPGTIKDLVEELHQKNIYVVLRQNAEGRLYGITFVDNKNKVVFNGSELGKGYSINALQTRFTKVGDPVVKLGGQKKSPLEKVSSSLGQHSNNKETSVPKSIRQESVLDALLSAKEDHASMPSGLIKKKRKKKKRNHDL